MKLKQPYVLILLFILLISISNCGPVYISSGTQYPIAEWFYPNRVVSVRYIYFPGYSIYYDLSFRDYIYRNKGMWVRVKVLPSRFNSINFRREKQIRIDNYFDDDISRYHSRRNPSLRR